MREILKQRFQIGLFGLCVIIMLAVILLRLGHKPSDKATVDIAPHSVTNTIRSVTQVYTNAAVRSQVTDTVSAVKAEQPSPQRRNSLVSTNVLVKKSAVRKIENDPKISKNRQVLLSHRRIVVENGRKFPTRFCASQTMTVRKTAPYVLLSEKPVDRSVHSQAMANGAKVAGFLPNNALLIETCEAALKNLSEDTTFIAAVEYEPLDKIQPLLLANTNETVEVKIVLMSAVYLDAMCDYVAAQGGQVANIAKNNKSFFATLSRKFVTELAAKGEIRWIECRTR